MRRFWTLTIATSLVAGTVILGPARAAAATALPDTVTVPATADIFGAGAASAPKMSGGGVSMPIEVDVQAGGTLIFSASGQVSCGPPPTHGADGAPCNYSQATNIDAYGGISGIIDNASALFLVGVFVGPAAPTSTAPSALDFSPGQLGQDFTTLSPELQQTFFIGDGQTSAGTIQQFTAPAGATRLFLGFADAWYLTGPPGYYGDNSGSLQVTVALQGTSPLPGPAYVAFGDSIATGFTSATCNPGSASSLFDGDTLSACYGTPPTAPYPSLLAADVAGLGPVQNVSVFGQTAMGADETFRYGWRTFQWNEYPYVLRATHLVTGALGINDVMLDSEIPSYIVKCLQDIENGTVDRCMSTAAHWLLTVPDGYDVSPYQAIHDEMDVLHQANVNGVHVIVPLYDNPYTDEDPNCSLLHMIAGVQVELVNYVLQKWYVSSASLQYVETDSHFDGHRVGDPQSWVSGKSCDAAQLLNTFLPADLQIAAIPITSPDSAPHGYKAAAILIDPHPTQQGQDAIEEAILRQGRFS